MEMNKLSVTTALSLSFLAASVSFAGDPRCPSHEPFSQVINNLCWDCIFPIYVSGIKINASSSSNDGASTGKTKKFHNPGVPDDA